MLKEKEEEWNLFKGAIDSILDSSLKEGLVGYGINN